MISYRIIIVARRKGPCLRKGIDCVKGLVLITLEIYGSVDAVTDNASGPLDDIGIAGRVGRVHVGAGANRYCF